MPRVVISAAGQAVWYADQRKPGSAHPPLLLIHGAAGTHLDWPMTLRRLNALVPDLPGHGKSAPPGRQTIDAYAADLRALLDALGIDRVVAVGHSMGGAVALTLALDFPERVAGLMLLGTGAHLPVNPAILRMREAQAEVGQMLKKWFWSRATPDAVRERGYQLFMQIPAEVAYGDYLACAQFDVRDRLGQIAAPALVMVGEADVMTPPAYSALLAERLPHAERVTLPDAGHMLAVEQPEAVGEAARAWLVARWPAGRV